MESWLSIKELKIHVDLKRHDMLGASGDPVAEARHGAKLELFNDILLELGRVARGETTFRPDGKIFAEKKSEIEKKVNGEVEKIIAEIEREAKPGEVKRLAAALRIAMAASAESEPSAMVRNLEKALDGAIRRHDRFGGEDNRQEILNLGRTLEKAIEDEKKSAGIENIETEIENAPAEQIGGEIKNTGKASEKTSWLSIEGIDKAVKVVETTLNILKGQLNLQESTMLEDEFKDASYVLDELRAISKGEKLFYPEKNRGEIEKDAKERGVRVSPGGEIEIKTGALEKNIGVTGIEKDMDSSVVSWLSVESIERMIKKLPHGPLADLNNPAKQNIYWVVLKILNSIHADLAGIKRGILKFIPGEIEFEPKKSREIENVEAEIEKAPAEQIGGEKEKSEMVRNLEKCIEETTERHDEIGGEAILTRLVNLKMALFNVLEDEKLERKSKGGFVRDKTPLTMRESITKVAEQHEFIESERKKSKTHHEIYWRMGRRELKEKIRSATERYGTVKRNDEGELVNHGVSAMDFDKVFKIETFRETFFRKRDGGHKRTGICLGPGGKEIAEMKIVYWDDFRAVHSEIRIFGLKIPEFSFNHKNRIVKSFEIYEDRRNYRGIVIRLTDKITSVSKKMEQVSAKVVCPLLISFAEIQGLIPRRHRVYGEKNL